jgi:hypothetical protein
MGPTTVIVDALDLFTLVQAMAGIERRMLRLWEAGGGRQRTTFAAHSDGLSPIPHLKMLHHPCIRSVSNTSCLSVLVQTGATSTSVWAELGTAIESLRQARR